MSTPLIQCLQLIERIPMCRSFTVSTLILGPSDRSFNHKNWCSVSIRDKRTLNVRSPLCLLFVHSFFLCFLLLDIVRPITSHYPPTYPTSPFTVNVPPSQPIFLGRALGTLIGLGPFRNLRVLWGVPTPRRRPSVHETTKSSPIRSGPPEVLFTDLL